MTMPSVPFARRAAAPATLSPRIAEDRRRHKRYPVSLVGRFMRFNKLEYPCRLIDISPGGAAFQTAVLVNPNEKIVAYIEHLGGIEGTVARVFEGGFAMRFSATQHKREKLAAQITWLINRQDLDPAEARRHERRPLANKMTSLLLPDGQSVTCRVIDVSLSGASIAIDNRPPIGAEVLFGKLRSRVLRHHDLGIGVQFLDIQDPEALRKTFA